MKIGLQKTSVLWAVLASVLTAVLWVVSIPPFDFAEAAYVALVPLILWLFLEPSWKRALLFSFLSSWAAWCVILIWLRHVTVFGTLALAAVLAALFLLWVAGARWILPKVAGRAFVWRAVGFLGLAGLWVVVEWVRSWIFWGFPWAPLALSQWERPVVLQIAAWTGAYGVSFVLVFFNLCVAYTLRSRVVVPQRRLLVGWFSPDLYLALGALGVCISVFFVSLPARDSKVDLLTAGVVQPYITPELKWDEAKELENLEILELWTRRVGIEDGDVVLWPEAATPWPVEGSAAMQERLTFLVNELRKPILMGAIGWRQATDKWYNGALVVNPVTGMDPAVYVKRELVPFGEYVPRGFRFIEKVVPLGGDFISAEGAGLVPLTVGERTLQIGSLVCYEDSFPGLARESAAAGADIFFVAANNAWYKEEGGAPQHAAHSVLRAVENRRPVMRCGNGGWSGWIDAYGMIRDVLVDAEGSVYFRGGGSYTVFQFEEWMGRESYYTRKGDWFVVLSAALFVFACVPRKKITPRTNP